MQMKLLILKWPQEDKQVTVFGRVKGNTGLQHPSVKE